MPLYDLMCIECGHQEERQVPLAEYNGVQRCEDCGGPMVRQILTAPLSRMAGVAAQGGGPDRFTADMLGIPLKELPDGLKTKVTP